MKPERLRGEIGKLIARICRGPKLPPEWSAADFVSLINGYKGLSEVLRAEHPTSKEPTLDEIYRNGLPGAYESMVKRLEQRERRNQSTKKRKKQNQDMEDVG